MIAADARCPESLSPFEVATRESVVVSTSLKRNVIADEIAEEITAKDIGPIGESILVARDLQRTHPPPARSLPGIDKWRLDRSVTAIQP